MSNSILNFAIIVPDRVFRGAQPSRDGMDYLQSIGVKTLLQLSYQDEGCYDLSLFKCIDIPMPPRDIWGIFDKPDLTDALKALEYLTDENNWPIYVHCLHGEDRTGMISAMFRVKKQEWAPGDAYIEWVKLAGHPILLDLQRTWDEFINNLKFGK